MEGTAKSDPVSIQGQSKPVLARFTFTKKDRYENEWDEARPETPPTSIKGPLLFGKPRPSKFSQLAAEMETEDLSSADPLPKPTVVAAKPIVAQAKPIVALAKPIVAPAIPSTKLTSKNTPQGKGLLKEAQLKDFEKNAGVTVAVDELRKGVSGEIPKVQRRTGAIPPLSAEMRSSSDASEPVIRREKKHLTNTERRHSWFGVVQEEKAPCVPQTVYLPEQRRWFGLGPLYQPTQTVCVPIQPKVNIVDQVKQKGLSTRSKQFYHQDSDRDFFVDKKQDFPKIKKICPRSDAEFNAIAPSTM